MDNRTEIKTQRGSTVVFENYVTRIRVIEATSLVVTRMKLLRGREHVVCPVVEAEGGEDEVGVVFRECLLHLGPKYGPVVVSELWVVKSRERTQEQRRVPLVRTLSRDVPRPSHPSVLSCKRSEVSDGPSRDDTEYFHDLMTFLQERKNQYTSVRY